MFKTLQALTQYTFFMLCAASLSSHAQTVKIGDININPANFDASHPTETRIAVCISCHGKFAGGDIDFGPNVAFGTPALRGLTEDYLTASLNAYKNNQRIHPEMNAVAALLDEKTITFMARTFASYPNPTAKTNAALATQRAKDPLFKQGEAIAISGSGSQSVIPCSTCHGQKGEGNDNLGPRLAGQNPLYIAAQIEQYATNKRNTQQAKTMQTIAVRLSSEDMKAVAHYYSNLIEVPKPKDKE